MIPLWIKISYTLFVAVQAPVYWIYHGPANFLWGSDIALLVMVIALWRESPLLTSMMALAVLLPELLWNLDFFSRLLAGRDVIGLDATGYMFNPAQPPWLRGLSLFHVFLPLVIVFMLYRLGYDRRALLATTALCWVVLPATYLFTEPERNINWVYGWSNQPQTWLPPLVYLAGLMLLVPLLVYLPTHSVLRKTFREPKSFLTKPTCAA
ncbi:MAG: membrane-associated protein [Gammaproteobacteria bacterium]|nr:membrane-associated protein [Gammaproteobacteria bacterium]